MSSRPENLFDGIGFGKKKKPPQPKLLDIVDTAKNNETDVGSKNKSREEAERKKRDEEEERRRRERDEEDRKRREEEDRKRKEDDEAYYKMLKEDRERDEKEREVTRKKREEEEKRLRKLDEDMFKQKSKVISKDAEVQVEENEDDKKAKSTKKNHDDMRPVTVHVHVLEDGTIETTYEMARSPSPVNSPTGTAVGTHDVTKDGYKFNRKFKEDPLSVSDPKQQPTNPVIVKTVASRANDQNSQAFPKDASIISQPGIGKPLPKTIQRSQTTDALIKGGNPYKTRYLINSSESDEESEDLPIPVNTKNARSMKGPKVGEETHSEGETDLPQKNKGTKKTSARGPRRKTSEPSKLFDWEKKIANSKLDKKAPRRRKQSLKLDEDRGRSSTTVPEKVLPQPTIPMRNKKTSLLGYEYSVV